MSLKVYLAALVALVGTCCVPARVPTHEELALELTTKTVSLVDMEDPNDPRTFCSGVWVSRREILTANHCTKDQDIGDVMCYAVVDDVMMTLDGKEVVHPHAGALVARDEGHDLALIRVNEGAMPEHGIAEISLGDVRPGATAVAMGSPLGLGWSWSSGEIAQIRYVNQEGLGFWYVQATTPIGPGSSGGGLFDYRGRLIGIVRGSYTRGENLNLFIHRDHILAFLTNVNAGKMHYTDGESRVKTGD